MKSKTVLKLAFALSMLFGAASAFANQSYVYLESLSSSSQRVSKVEYVVNKKLNRAWLEVTYYYPGCRGGDDCPEEITRKIKAKGLYFNPKTEEFYFDNDDTYRVCAKLKSHWWGESYSEETGKCGVVTAPRVRQNDNGFDVSEEQVLDIYFSVQ